MIKREFIKKMLPTMLVVFLLILGVASATFLYADHAQLRQAEQKLSQGTISNSESVFSELNVTLYFGLENTKVPFEVVNLTPFSNTLVTFELPSSASVGNGLGYVSVVWTGNGTTSYLFNGSSYASSKIFSHSVYKGKFSRNVSYKVGNFTSEINMVAKVWVTPLPGGYNDPTIVLYQNDTIWDVSNNWIGKVYTQGEFNYILGGTITGVDPQGSHAVGYNGYGVCYQDILYGGQGGTLGFVQTNAQATLCLGVVSDWWASWPGFGLNSLNGVVTYNSYPIDNGGTAAGCPCGGFSFPPAP